MLLNQRLIAQGKLNKHPFDSDRWKWDRYDQYRTFRGVLNEVELSAETQALVRKQIERMKAPFAPFAGMIRYFDRLPLHS